MTATVIESPRRYTPEEFELLPDVQRYELFGGYLLERNMSFYSGMVSNEISWRVSVHAHSHSLGRVLGVASGLQIFPNNPSRVVFTDGAFIGNGRAPGGYPLRGWGHTAPDLVWEVVSPTDLAEDVQSKARDYLSAGVRLVWVVYPRTRHVDVYRIDGSSSIVNATDVLSGEDILPGFEVLVGDLFPPVEDEDSAE